MGCIRNPLLFAKLFSLRKKIYSNIGELTATYANTPEPIAYNDRLSLNYKPINVGEEWGGFYECAWFNMKGVIEKSNLDKNIQLIIDVDGEGCVYNNNGSPVKGLSKRLCFADAINTVDGKHIFVIDNPTENIDLWIETGNNGWDGKSTGQARLKRADIVICNRLMYDYYFDFTSLFMVMTSLAYNCERFKEINNSLKKSLKLLKDFSDKSINLAKDVLEIELSKKNDSEDKFQFYATGHAHLDLAWLWPIRETKRKAARTFSNQLNLIDNTDDYIFGASQPQQFDWMKNLYPDLYKRLQEAAAKDRLELQGGMWVEADTNVIGSEAMVRQMLYGKKFFNQEFNKDMKILWLPDVFGFSGALPQVIKKCGMDYFLTIKLSWNEQNPFPYHSFIWEGIDNSKVLVHMPPEGTYNSDILALSVKDAYDRYKEKHTNCAFIPYGVGDGGGGPGESHYNFAKRVKDLKGVKRVKMSTANDFFTELNKHYDSLPSHKGELYLEKHQGTFTSQAKNKLYNRKIEIKLRNVEYLGSFAAHYGYKFPREQIEKIWKEVLLYQFHDIIPGSSINRVYEESVARYLEMLKELDDILYDIYDYLSKGKKGNTAINTLQYSRNEWVKVNKEWQKIEVKPFATSTMEPALPVFKELSFSDYHIENDLIKVVFNLDGSIKSYYDKVNNMNFSGDYLNKLAVYKDKKLYYNAWDIDINYTKQTPKYFKLLSTNTYIDGPAVVRQNKYIYNKSTLIQDVVLMINKDYVEFNTYVDWRETHKMLRAEFRPSVYSDKVLCDIQWGNLTRSTKTDNPIDYAQYEICAHKYVDVSNNGYGFAIINDCKYGHRVKDGLISLNLLRSPVYPDEVADKGEHRFTYYVYAHKEEAYQSKLIEYSHCLNNPLLITNSQIPINTVIECDKDNIIIETIKIAEDNNDIIVRLYETNNKETIAKLNTTFEYTKAYECDMLENNTNLIELDNLSFTPFEIKTIKLAR